MKIVPVGAGMLVRVEEQKMSKGGIILAESNRKTEGKEVGTVLAMGDMCFEPPIGNGTKWCEIGDKIIFKKYAGIVPSDSDEFCRIIQDSDVIAKVEE